ncbi:MAG: histidine ammonia-lyase [Crocinitomicaceae bacterium]|nr:histidine ammonia-lyase [Crocinitomicaceae bacterium]
MDGFVNIEFYPSNIGFSQRRQRHYIRSVKGMELTNGLWGVDTVWNAVKGMPKLSLSSDMQHAIEHCRDYLEAKLNSDGGAVIYGVNTGFGDLASARVDAEALSQLQRNLLVSHACGVGEEVPEEIVRAMVLLKIKSLGKGHSGVRLETVQRLVKHWNAHLFPVVPSQGSLGASGDLAPLSHMVLPLIGEGEVWVEGTPVPSSEVLAAKGWQPLVLGAKEGLALINGTQLMLGYGVMAMERLERIADWADALCAWSLEAWYGRIEPFDPSIHQVRNQANAELVAQNVTDWLKGSQWQAQPRAQVQDPYSFRCTPQVHGASRNSLSFARAVLENELNAVTDNPLIFPDEDKVLSGGNFHGQPLALQLEAMALAAHEWGSISERRTYKLLSGKQGLPPFLVANPGLNSGFMIPQYTAASLVSQNKQLCAPNVVDTIDSSNGQEDHVSMGANAALKLWKILDNVEQVLAIECITAAQACDLRSSEGMAPALAGLQRSLRRVVSFVEADTYMQPHLLAARDWMFSRELSGDAEHSD